MIDIWEPFSEVKELDTSQIFENSIDEFRILVTVIEIRPTTVNCNITDISNLKFVNRNEAKKFLTAKRNEEHASGRYLLEKTLRLWDRFLDLSQLEVRRDENTRRPFLSWIEGTYQGKELPNFSISHSNGIAIIALCETSYSVGVDIEPIDQNRSEGLMEFMSAGNELSKIRNYWDKDSIDRNRMLNRVWTIKESCMKTLGIGMGINPINLEIPDKVLENFSIGKSNFQLEYSGEKIDIFNDILEFEKKHSLSIAIRKKNLSELPQLTQAEIEILESLSLPSNNLGCANN
mgnify:CR=1 FL=1